MPNIIRNTIYTATKYAIYTCTQSKNKRYIGLKIKPYRSKYSLNIKLYWSKNRMGIGLKLD